MFKSFAAIAMLAATTAVAAAPKNPSLVLDKGVVMLRGAIDDDSVAKVVQQILLSEGDTVQLFLSSPGGSVVSGLSLISTMKASGKKFVCVTDFSASMSFIVMQACDERIVQSHSVMMQHQMAYGVQGQPERKVDSFLKLIRAIGDDANEIQAKRIGISVAKLKEDTRDDMWLFGDRSVKYGAADSVRGVLCSPELLKGQVVENVQVMMFTVKVTWSSCPLITSPLKVEMPNGITREANDKFFKTMVNFRSPEGVIRE